MKSNQTLAGVILTAFGIYFVSQQFNVTVPYAAIIFKWPTILVIMGAILSWQGFSNRNDGKMFSGIILLGFGILFHGIYTFQYWHFRWPYITLIFAVAFLLKHLVNKRDGASPGLILLIISLAAIFFSRLINWLNSFHSSMEMIWPFCLIGLGLYLLVFRRK